MLAALVACAGASAIATVFAVQLGRQYVARRRAYALVWCLSMALFAVAAASVVVGLTAGWWPPVYAVFWLSGALITVPLLAAGQLMLLDRDRSVLYGTVAGLVVLWGVAGVLLSPVDPEPLQAATAAGAIPVGADVYGDALAHALLRPFNYSAVIVVAGTIWSAVRSRRFRILGIAVGVLIAGLSFTFVRAGRVDLFGLALAAGVALMYAGFLAAGKSPRRPREAGQLPAPQSTRRPVVTVYTREGCGLCRKAEAVVDDVARGRADVRRVDIDRHPDLSERYTVRVPVVAVDGREVAEYQLAPEELDAALRAAQQAAPTA